MAFNVIDCYLPITLFTLRRYVVILAMSFLCLVYSPIVLFVNWNKTFAFQDIINKFLFY